MRPPCRPPDLQPNDSPQPVPPFPRLRAAFTLADPSAIQPFLSPPDLFPALLISTAYAQARSGGHDDHEDYKENLLLRAAKKAFPTTDEYHSDKLSVRLDGKRFITPLAIALIAIGSADILFAVDSIPAIFGLTQETRSEERRVGKEC